MSSIADIRKDYRLKALLENEAANSPIDQFTKWWNDALNAQLDEVNAMTLATASADGVPSARIVLLKGYDETGFLFFTNYNSFKGKQMEENPRACLVFFWKELERQVRITGIVEKATTNESDDYFNSRPLLSRIGAWASPQSEVIEDREWLDANEEKYKLEFGETIVQRPPHWGGYRVKPVEVEFWQGRPGRLHDRLLYTVSDDNSWKMERLAP